MSALIEPFEPPPSADVLFERFCAVVLQWGFDRVAYADFSRSLDPVLASAQADRVAVSYSREWTQYYLAEKHQEHDTLFGLAACNTRPIDWDEGIKIARTRRQKEVFRDAHDAGHYHGITVPFHGPRGFTGSLSLCTSGNRSDTYRSIPQVAALCSEFRALYDLLDSRSETLVPPPHLSPREREVLIWIARGKTNSAIGDIMGITERSVETYVKRIFDKLNVQGRIPCVVVASRFGLISPMREI
jgi:LuxR family quorum sensing-dependent transcriptional regulator